MATNDPFAKERANLSAGTGDEAGNLSSALGLTSPIVKPPLPTGPKPIPTPNQIGNYPGGSVAPMSAPVAALGQPSENNSDIGKIAALRGSTDESAILSGLSTATQEQYRASGEAARLEQINLEKDTEKQAKLAKDYAEKARVEEAQKEAKTGQHREFVPTQESVKDLGMLFSLVSVAAFSSGGEGRYSGMAAMKNMSAAMQGYREGRNDIFNKELKEYDKNMAALKANNDLAQKTYENAMKLLAIDKEAGLAEMKHLAALDNNGAVAMKVRAHDWEGVAKALEIRAKFVQLSDEKRNKLIQDARDKANALEERKREANMRDSRAAQNISIRLDNQSAKGELVTMPDGKMYRVVGNQLEPIKGAVPGMTKLGTPGKGSVTPAQFKAQQSRFLNSVSEAASNLESLGRMNVKTSGKWYEQDKTLNGLFTSPLKSLDSKLSSEDSQILSQRMAGIAQNLASIETLGAATGLAGLRAGLESRLKIPPDASVAVALNALGDMRQIVEAAVDAQSRDPAVLPEIKQANKQYMDRIRKAIPFTLEDLDKARAAEKGSLKIPVKDANLSFTEFAKRYGTGTNLDTKAATRAADVESSWDETIPTVSSKEQYDALPPNALYMEDGQQYRKPK